MTKTEKKAVVLGGGGARGAYEFGVWQALQEERYTYDIVTGTSVGSLNGALMVMGDMDMAKEIWSTIETEKILTANLPENLTDINSVKKALGGIVGDMVKANGFSYEPLKKLLISCVDEEKMRLSPVVFGLNTTKMRGLKKNEVFLADMPQGTLIDHMLASAACYPSMHPYTFNGETYIDGGYTDNLTISMALQGGATEILAVDLLSPGINASYQNPGHVPIRIIKPRWDLGMLLIFDSARASRNMRIGYLETKKMFGKFDGFQFTFALGEMEKEGVSGVGLPVRVLLEKCKLNFFHEVAAVNIPANIFRRHLLAALECASSHKPQMADLLTLGAETLGDIFGVSPMEVYTLESFNEKILAGVNGEKNAYEMAVSEKEILDDMVKGLQIVNRKKQMKTMMAVVGKAEYAEGDRRHIFAWATIYGQELAAAIYAVAANLPLFDEKNSDE